jgi:hypothetical protein
MAAATSQFVRTELRQVCGGVCNKFVLSLTSREHPEAKEGANAENAEATNKANGFADVVG